MGSLVRFGESLEEVGMQKQVESGCSICCVNFLMVFRLRKVDSSCGAEQVFLCKKVGKHYSA